MDSMDLNQAQNEVFCHFLEFGSLVFLDIAYNDSLKQCLTSSKCKTHEKNFGGPNFDQTSQKQAGNQVFHHVLKFGSLVFL